MGYFAVLCAVDQNKPSKLSCKYDRSLGCVIMHAL